MLGRVLVLRRIATADMSADHAHSQVDPRIADLDAVLADMLAGLFYLDLIEMSALAGHLVPPKCELRSVTLVT
jgi:hypothetical protein